MTNKKIEYLPKWDRDVLNRSESAKFLTGYLNSLYAEEADEAINSNSFVLCLNAEWGYGKTFLIKNWAKDLKSDLNHPVVYFDAWQNDFSDDPLLAFISELENSLIEFETLVPKGDALVKSVIDTGKGAIAPVLKTAANIFLNKVVGADSEEIVQVFNAASEGAIDTYVNNALEAHNNRKSKVKQFSAKLGDLLEKLKEKDFSLPMYVFIDELDRCKPSYAIQLLEGIKHIFGTAGVFFIIATNKVQLSKSIKAVYGAEFDSLGYLQRFFDQEYQLPQPDFQSFSKLLINKYRLINVAVENLDLTSYGLVETFAVLAEGFQLSLRSQDQVAKQFKAIVISNSIPRGIHHWFLLFLLMLKAKNEVIYDEFTSGAGEGEKIASLRKCFNTMLEIEGFVPSGDHYQVRRDRVSVLALIQEYFRVESMSSIKLFDQGHTTYGTLGAIRVKLQREAPNSYTPGTYYPLSISLYRKVIMHSGQIS